MSGAGTLTRSPVRVGEALIMTGWPGGLACGDGL